MARRALIGLALCVVLFAASGVQAADWKVERSVQRDGCAVVKVTFIPGSVDTSAHVGVDVADKVNDSLIFNSPEFVINTNWTTCWVRGFYLPNYQDTITTSDSISYKVQNKCSEVGDSTWHTVLDVNIADEDLINASPVKLDGKVWADADSVLVCDAFRLRVSLVAEEATWRGEDVSGVIPFNARYMFYLYFADKGNQ